MKQLAFVEHQDFLRWPEANFKVSLNFRKI